MRARSARNECIFFFVPSFGESSAPARAAFGRSERAGAVKQR
jgi:hypothetical protein